MLTVSVGQGLETGGASLRSHREPPPRPSDGYAPLLRVLKDSSPEDISERRYNGHWKVMESLLPFGKCPRKEARSLSYGDVHNSRPRAYFTTQPS
ncbi:hypothetical protein E5288_WYG004491 [Bos mutus]|uniref:Uncharacterized protein n=1 Tax=Bos mutus TaxID=72004 RepID=A0A6B0RWU9_9CETA|nr:hypothetical protein [Bos mutus]